MLRGAQTPGELNQRTQRLHPFSGLDAVHETLERLAAGVSSRGSAADPGRRRSGTATSSAKEATRTRRAAAPEGTTVDLEARVAALEADVAALREELAALRGD